MADLYRTHISTSKYRDALIQIKMQILLRTDFTVYTSPESRNTTTQWMIYSKNTSCREKETSQCISKYITVLFVSNKCSDELLINHSKITTFGNASVVEIFCISKQEIVVSETIDYV